LLAAIQSVVSSTIDTYLKIISPEVKRRKLGKILFELYRHLDEVSRSMDNISQILRHATDPTLKFPTNGLLFLRDEGALNGASMVELKQPWLVDPSKPPEATISVSSAIISGKGTLSTSTVHDIPERVLLLGVALPVQIRGLNTSFRQLADLMSVESRELWRRGGLATIQKIGVFKPELVEQLYAAWEHDGGFVGVILRLRLGLDFDERVVRLLDSRFVPAQPWAPGAFSYSRNFSLDNPEELAELLSLIDECSASVRAARDSVRLFMIDNLTIVDII
jgi:hypothetical protein